MATCGAVIVHSRNFERPAARDFSFTRCKSQTISSDCSIHSTCNSSRFCPRTQPIDIRMHFELCRWEVRMSRRSFVCEELQTKQNFEYALMSIRDRIKSLHRTKEMFFGSVFAAWHGLLTSLLYFFSAGKLLVRQISKSNIFLCPFACDFSRRASSLERASAYLLLEYLTQQQHDKMLYAGYMPMWREGLGWISAQSSASLSTPTNYQLLLPSLTVT